GHRQAGGAGDGRLRSTLRAGPQTDPPLLERGRLRRGLALAGHQLSAWNVFVPREVPAHRLDVLVRLSIGELALDLRPVSGELVVDLHADFRDRTGLTVYLNRAAVGV